MLNPVCGFLTPEMTTPTRVSGRCMKHGAGITAMKINFAQVRPRAVSKSRSMFFALSQDLLVDMFTKLLGIKMGVVLVDRERDQRFDMRIKEGPQGTQELR